MNLSYIKKKNLTNTKAVDESKFLEVEATPNPQFIPRRQCPTTEVESA